MHKFILAIILSILIISCKSSFITKRDRVKLDGDELPGIGGTKEQPDTCVAYYDKHKRAVILRYSRTN